MIRRAYTGTVNRWEGERTRYLVPYNFEEGSWEVPMAGGRVGIKRVALGERICQNVEGR